MHAGLLGDLGQNLEVEDDDLLCGVNKTVGNDSLNQLEDAI